MVGIEPTGKELFMKSSLRPVLRGAKSLVVCAALLAAVLPAATLAAQDVVLPLKTIEVKHFTQADGAGLSQDFLNYFYDGLRAELPKTKVAEQVVDEGGTVPDADAANSVVVEGKFLENHKSGLVHYVLPEINLYRRSDHSLIKTISPKVPYKSSPFNKDKNVAEYTGRRTAYEILRALKKR
jgi:hypothetical protein